MSKQTKQEKEKEEKDKRIGVAVNFINTPNLLNVPRSELEKFLKKKGLNDAEIIEAFEKAKSVKEEMKAKELEKEKELINKVQQLGVIPQTQADNFINPQELNEIVEKAKTSNLISIRNRGVTTLYDQILNLNTLQILIISNNKIHSIPQNISQLINLRDHNIDDQFFNLTSLQELNLAKNQLSNVNRIVTLINLILLDLSNNEIFQIPEAINQLTQLKLLSFRDNHLTKIPEQLKELKSLKKLYLDQNAIDDPKEVLKQTDAQKILEQGVFDI